MTVLSEQKGRRVPDDEWFELRDRGELRPGDYGLVTGEDGQTEDDAKKARAAQRAHPNERQPRFSPYCGACSDELVRVRAEPWQSDPCAGWHARCPNGVDVNLSQCHPVTLQEDGTVSVSGSILAGDWHGWLCRGVWRLA